jgi:hypothetical protein
MIKFKLNRDVSKNECSWLDKDLNEGTIVYKYTQYTYGCISRNGIACSFEFNVNPFFELPIDSLIEI